MQGSHGVWWTLTVLASATASATPVLAGKPETAARKVFLVMPEHSPRPLPCERQAFVERQFAAQRLAFQRRTLLDAYESCGRRDPKWDAPVRACLGLFAPRFAGLLDSPSDRRLHEAAKKAVEAGCDDPLIGYLYGTACCYLGRWEQAEDVVRRAWRGYESSRYPSYRRSTAARRLGLICQEVGNRQEEARQWFARAIKLQAASAVDGTFRPGEERVFWFHVEGNSLYKPPERSKMLWDALDALKTADPWLLDLAGGWHHVWAAWAARGTGYAKTVTDEGWRGWRRHLAEAERLLTRAWRRRPEHPEPCVHMITVAMGSAKAPVKSCRLWFDRAVAAQFDSYEAYVSLMWALRPRWHGSWEAMLKLGRECLATKRFDTFVPTFYFKAVRDVNSEAEGEFWTADGVFDRLHALFDGMLADPSWHASLKRHYRTQFAAVAYRAHRYRVARRLFDELGGSVDRSELTKLGVPRNTGVSEVYARTGPKGGDVQPALDLYARGDVAGAVAKLEPVLAACRKDNRKAREYLIETLVLWRFGRDLAAGRWIDFMPRRDYAGWRSAGGKGFRFLKDGALQIEAVRGRAGVTFRAPVGGAYEIRGQIECVSGRGSGVCLGLMSDPARGCYLRFDHEKGRVLIEQWTSGDATAAEKKLTLPSAPSFLVQVWDRKATLYIDGRLVLADVLIDNGSIEPELSRIGLGACASNGVSRWRGIQVRRLTSAPKPPKRTP